MVLFQVPALCSAASPGRPTGVRRWGDLAEPPPDLAANRKADSNPSPIGLSDHVHRILGPNLIFNRLTFAAELRAVQKPAETVNDEFSALAHMGRHVPLKGELRGQKAQETRRLGQGTERPKIMRKFHGERRARRSRPTFYAGHGSLAASPHLFILVRLRIISPGFNHTLLRRGCEFFTPGVGCRIVNYVVVALLCAAFAASPDQPKLRKATVKAQAAAERSEKGEKKDPVEEEYDKLIEQDEAALKDVEKLNAEFEKFDPKGAAGPKAALIAKIDQRLQPVKKAYEEFLSHHPEHIDGRIAYGSFLNEIGEEEDAITQWEKARELDPKNPTPWNNLANVYAHIGPIKKALQYYERAIELDPQEPVYLQTSPRLRIFSART